MAPPAFLCYRLAYRAKKAGEITEEEYFQHVFQHMIWEHDCTAMAKSDSLGFVIRDVCYSNEHLINGYYTAVASQLPTNEQIQRPSKISFWPSVKVCRETLRPNLRRCQKTTARRYERPSMVRTQKRGRGDVGMDPRTLLGTDGIQLRRTSLYH